MTDLATVDFFSDPAVSQSPYEYWDHLREQGPVTREPHYGVVAVTGYQEVMAAFKDHDSFSAVNAIGGPFPPLPFTPEGDDISEQIEAHRHLFPIHEHMVVMDPPAHEKARSLLSRLLTPRRLKENEDYMWQLVDSQIDQFIGNGRCEFLSEYAKPFATSAIIDLLGVPEEDRPEFLAALGAEKPEGTAVGALDGEPVGLDPLKYLDDKFLGYLTERRREPREDVLSGMAAAVYPDGSTPELIEVVKPATFLFAAGQETVTKLLSAAVQVLGDRPDYQQLLRAEPDRIPTFIEEAVRMHSPTKVDFRLVRKTTTLGGVRLPAGTIVMLCLGAANRDPRQVRGSARVPARPQERPRAHRLRPRHPHLRRCAAGAGRRPDHRAPAAGPDVGDQDRRVGARPRRRPHLQLRADVPAARPDRIAHRFHPAAG